VDPLTKPEWRAGVRRVLADDIGIMVGTGGPSGISAPVGSTWRQTDANASHGSLTGLLWNKVGTGTTEGTDWLVDYEGRPAWATLASGNIVKASDSWAQVTTWTGTLKGVTHSSGQLTVPTPGIYLVTAQVDVASSCRAVLSYDKDSDSGAYTASTRWLLDSGTPSLATDAIWSASEIIEVTSTLRFYAYLTTGTHVIRLQVARLSPK
jgi:hypothetical protein